MIGARDDKQPSRKPTTQTAVWAGTGTRDFNAVVSGLLGEMFRPQYTTRTLENHIRTDHKQGIHDHKNCCNGHTVC